MFDKRIHIVRHYHVAPEIRDAIYDIRKDLALTNERLTIMSNVQQELLDTINELGVLFTDTLGVCSELLQRAVNANDLTLVIEANTKLKQMKKDFANAIRAMDPTKETPVAGADPDPINALADTYENLGALEAAVALYAGPEKVIARDREPTTGTFAETVVRDGTEPALVFERAVDSLEMKKVTA